VFLLLFSKRDFHFFCQCATMAFEISHLVVMIYDANWPFCAVWKNGWVFKTDWKSRRGGRVFEIF